MFRAPSRDELVSTLTDLSRPIAARMRAIFYLRSMADHREENVAVLCQALRNESGTALFRHEIAYVLGQMQEASAVPTLRAILENVSDDVVVRHEVGCTSPLAPALFLFFNALTSPTPSFLLPCSAQKL